MALWLFLIPPLVLSSMPDMASMQRDLDRLSAISDPFSVRITDENFLQVKNGSMWVVNFCHPKAMHCKLLNVPWKALAEEVREENERVIVARVEPDDGLNVFRSFGVADVPTVLVITQGYVYNYTGKLEPRQLRELVSNETFLMYDRRVLNPGLKEVRYWLRWGYHWTTLGIEGMAKHPVCVAGTAAAVLVVAGLVYLYCRSSRKHTKVD